MSNGETLKVDTNVDDANTLHDDRYQNKLVDHINKEKNGNVGALDEQHIKSKETAAQKYAERVTQGVEGQVQQPVAKIEETDVEVKDELKQEEKPEQKAQPKENQKPEQEQLQDSTETYAKEVADILGLEHKEQKKEEKIEGEATKEQPEDALVDRDQNAKKEEEQTGENNPLRAYLGGKIKKQVRYQAFVTHLGDMMRERAEQGAIKDAA